MGEMHQKEQWIAAKIRIGNFTNEEILHLACILDDGCQPFKDELCAIVIDNQPENTNLVGVMAISETHQQTAWEAIAASEPTPEVLDEALEICDPTLEVLVGTMILETCLTPERLAKLVHCEELQDRAWSMYLETGPNDDDLYNLRPDVSSLLNLVTVEMRKRHPNLTEENVEEEMLRRRTPT